MFYWPHFFVCSDCSLTTVFYRGIGVTQKINESRGCTKCCIGRFSREVEVTFQTLRLREKGWYRLNLLKTWGLLWESISTILAPRFWPHQQKQQFYLIDFVWPSSPFNPYAIFITTTNNNIIIIINNLSAIILIGDIAYLRLLCHSYFILFVAVNNPYNNQLYLCAALPDNILLMQWYEPLGKFMKVNVSRGLLPSLSLW